jgi:hypothetical protein
MLQYRKSSIVYIWYWMYQYRASTILEYQNHWSRNSKFIIYFIMWLKKVLQSEMFYLVQFHNKNIKMSSIWFCYSFVVKILDCIETAFWFDLSMLTITFCSLWFDLSMLTITFCSLWFDLSMLTITFCSIQKQTCSHYDISETLLTWC